MSIQNFIGKVFSIQSNNHKLTTGELTLKSGDTIRVIAVGEEGRGRTYGIVPVVNVKSRTIQEEKSNYDSETGTWKKSVVYVQEYLPLEKVKLTFTKAGKPKFIEVSELPEKPEKDFVIVVSATPTGFRGSNDHLIVPKSFFEEILPKANQAGGESEIFSFIRSEARKPKTQLEKEKQGKMEDWKKTLLEKLPEKEETETNETNEIPMEVIVHGVIAEGAAGRAGSGDQYIHIMHTENVLITNICGRLYGRPGLFVSYFEDGKIKNIPISEYGMNE